MERDRLHSHQGKLYQDFNSHAHVERDAHLYIYNQDNLPISTHTLTWSVTICGEQNARTHNISTHTLTWSVTGINISVRLTAAFQLTRSRGAWPISFGVIPAKIEFQLTRSRGAWRIKPSADRPYQLFQLTRSRGAWPPDFFSSYPLPQFQLTRSRGAWPFLCTHGRWR